MNVSIYAHDFLQLSVCFTLPFFKEIKMALAIYLKTRPSKLVEQAKTWKHQYPKLMVDNTLHLPSKYLICRYSIIKLD